MPFVTSTPNNPVPVITPSVVQTANTLITWDSSNGTILTQLMLSKDGGKFTRFGAADKAPLTRGGKQNLPVQLGSEYDFELRQAGTDAVLARLVVTTREQNILLNPLIGKIHAVAPVRQAIYALRLDPGPESVRIHFRTRQPALPVMDVRRASDDTLAGATFGAAGTVHDYEVPLTGDPTPQASAFELHIFAPSTDSFDKPAETRVKFMTGTRRAEVFFDRLTVRDDGDPGFILGDGDFGISLGLGDTDSGDILGLTVFGGAVGSGEHRSIDSVVAADHAPPEVWVQAEAAEEDKDGAHFFSASLEFAPEGVRQEDLDDVEVIRMTKWFDLTAFPVGVGEVAFDLQTGARVFDLSISCRLRVDTQRGSTVQPDIARPRRAAYRAPDPVAYLGAGEEDRTGGTASLRRTPRGELYRMTSAPGKRRARWAQAAPATPGTITIVATDDRPQIFSLGEDGEARRLDAYGVWTPIGGRFIGRLLAVGGEGHLTLVGLDRQGVAHQSCGDGEWREVAGGVVGDLQAMALPGGLGLVARGAEDVVLFRGPEADGDWTRLGPAPRGKLAAAATDEGLAFAVLCEDETLVVALTGNPPERLDWRDAGDLTGLLDRRYSLADFAEFGVFTDGVATGSRQAAARG